MSAKGRAHEEVGEEREHHPTPAWCSVVLAEKLDLPDGDYLEIGAGEGNLIRAVGLARPGGRRRWTAIEIHEPCRARLAEVADEVIIGDARVVLGEMKRVGRRFDVAYFNPPFSLAFPLLLLALEVAETVVMLIRSVWVGDDEQRQRVLGNRLPTEYRLGRVSFDRKGSDSAPCSWLVWRREVRICGVGFYMLLRRPTETERSRDFDRSIRFPAKAKQLLLGGE